MALAKGYVGSGGYAHFQTGRRENEQKVISPTVCLFMHQGKPPRYASLARINESLAHS